MSDQENKNGVIAGGSVDVMVEQEGNRNMARSQEDLPEEHHLRSLAPAAPSVTEEIKRLSDDAVIIAIKDRTDVDYVPSDKLKHNLAKNLSSTTKRRDSPEAAKTIKSPESMLLAPVEVGRKGTSSPIPSDVKSLTADTIKLPLKAGMDNVHSLDGDKITEDTIEIRTPELAKKHSEWSDDEEAGGLPRSDSRASRVSRAVRQLFCCGVSYEAPSEENLSTPRGYATGI